MTRRDIIKIVKLINPKASIVESDGWINTNCLFENNHPRGDLRPSAGISIEPFGQSIYNCFGCTASGTLRDVLNKLCTKNIISREVVRFVENAEMVISYSKPLYRKKKKRPFSDYTKLVEGYSKIDSFWKRFLIRKNISINYHHKFFRLSPEGNLAIPIRIIQNNRLICVGVTERTRIHELKKGGSKYISNPKFPTRGILFPETTLTKKSYDLLLLVEGHLDGIYFFSKKIPCLSIMGAVNFHQEKIDRLMERFGPKEIYILLDNDKAGREGSKNIYKKLERDGRCIPHILKSDRDPRTLLKKDLNELILKGTEDEEPETY